MGHSEDLTLLHDCLHRLEREGFSSATLDPIGANVIGAVAVRLACDVVRGASADFGHPLGFGRVQLTPWELDRPRVAVHVWDHLAMSVVSEDAHDHCYDFVSVCYVGGLEHRLFQVRHEQGLALGAHSLEYAAGSCEAPGSTGIQEDLSVLEVDRFAVEAPEIYAIGCDVLHSAKPTSARTVTIQFQSPTLKSHAQVYRSCGHHVRSRASGSVSFTAERLARVMAGLC